MPCLRIDTGASVFILGSTVSSSIFFRALKRAGFVCPDVGKTLKLEPTPLAARMRALECTAEDISSALAAHDTPRDAIVESLKLAGFDRTYVARADRQRARVCGI